MTESVSTAIEGDAGSAPPSQNRPGTTGPPVRSAPQEGTASAGPRGVDSEATPGTRALPLDQTFELLRNQRRRYVLQFLEEEGQATLSELAEQIAAWENDKDVRQISSKERKRVYVGLYQCHLPKMDGMGVISFNKSRGWIQRGRQADAVVPYLDGPAAAEGPTRTAPIAGLSILGATVLPVAILLYYPSPLSILVAAIVVLCVTLAGIGALWRKDQR